MPLPLLTLLQPQSYPAPSISARIFTIPKLQNIHCGHFSGELYSLFSLLSSFFIKDLPNCYYVRPFPYSCHVEKNWTFMDHLSGALPTEKIFDILRQSIRSRSLMHHCPAELRFDMLKVIIKWLEVSFRERNRQLETPQTNNLIYFRDLVPSDRKTCTMVSRVNFFVSSLKRSLRQPGQTGFP